MVILDYIGMHPVLHKFIIFLSVFFIPINTLCAQHTRQITKTDEKKIKTQAKSSIERLQDEYNFFLTSNTQERNVWIRSLTTPGSQDRLFHNDQIIIENDFVSRKSNGIPKHERDLKFEDYVTNIATSYGKSDNEHEPNAGKKVIISDIRLSNVQALSNKDSLFIIAVFKIAYDGTARKTKFKFENAIRVARLSLENKDKNWLTFIESIVFYTDSTKINDKKQTVPVVEDKEPIEPIKYNEAISAQTKTVNRSPLLKAFMINNLWGLLNDEDQHKKILVQPKFCEINEFPEEEKLALVCLEGSWGYINREGVIEVECQYDIAESFKNGKARVQKGVKRFNIDVKGKEVK
jgi:hypothetical protein